MEENSLRVALNDIYSDHVIDAYFAECYISVGIGVGLDKKEANDNIKNSLFSISFLTKDLAIMKSSDGKILLIGDLSEKELKIINIIKLK